VLAVDHDTVPHDCWIVVPLRDLPGERSDGHAAHVALDIKRWPAAHAAQAAVLHDVAVIESIVNDHVAHIDHKTRLPVAADIGDESTARIRRDKRHGIP